MNLLFISPVARPDRPLLGVRFITFTLLIWAISGLLDQPSFAENLAVSEIASGNSEVMSVDESDDYKSWLSQFLDESQLDSALFTAGTSDPDGDGLSNYFEYIAMLDPMDRDSNFRIEFMDSEASRLLIGPVDDEVDYDLQFSRDLESWTSFEPLQFTLVDDMVEVDLGDLGPEIFFSVLVSRDLPVPILIGFTLVPAGTFGMGSFPSETGRDSDETRHEVTLTRSFYMGQTEITWNEWNTVRDGGSTRGYSDIGAGRNGLNGDVSGEHPVTMVSWWDAVKWCNLRSEIEGKTPVYYSSADLSAENILKTGSSSVYADWNVNGYRLPTEAEWEYACRSGTSTAFFVGGVVDEVELYNPIMDSVGWYQGNSELNTHAVGQKIANGLGLFDMNGNALEWCWDKYGPYEGDAIDPKGEANEDSSHRVARGGGWLSAAKDCRAAYRVSGNPIRPSNAVGFRVAYNSNP